MIPAKTKLPPLLLLSFPVAFHLLHLARTVHLIAERLYFHNIAHRCPYQHGTSAAHADAVGALILDDYLRRVAAGVDYDVVFQC